MKKLDHLMGRLSGLLAMLAALCTLLMMATMVLDVSNRVRGNGSIAGAYELVSMLLVMVVFLGFAYAERSETNVRVTLATSRMGAPVARVARLIGGVVSTGVVAIFAVATWDHALLSLERREFTQGLINFPTWPSKIAIAIGFTLLTLECLLGIWRRWAPDRAQDLQQELNPGADL